MKTIDEEYNRPAKQYASFTPWLIWATSAVFVLFQFFLQLSSGVIVEDLMQSFAINAVGAGILSSTYYYVYVTLQTPAGMLVDRYGPRRLLAGGGLICAIGCWLFGASKHLAVAEFGRLLMGAGSSFAFVSSLFLISKWFPIERFALMVGVAETAGTVGTLVGNIFLASVLSYFGWRNCLLGAAVIALIIGVACWLIIRDQPEETNHEVSIPSDSHFLQHILELLKNGRAWLNGIYSGLLFSVVTVFVALWGIPFLVKAYGISITGATIIGSFLFLGLAVGCPFIGAICNRLKNRSILLTFAAVISAVLLSCIILVTTLPLGIICCLMFFIGVLCSTYVINFAIAKEIAPPEATSTSIGFTNTLSVITAPLMQPVVGALLHLVHKVSTNGSAGVETYTVFDYQVALMILPIGLIGAAIIARYLK